MEIFGGGKFLLFGCVGIAVCVTFKKLLQVLFVGIEEVLGQREAVFFLFLHAIFWSAFMDATQYLYLSEVFLTHIRGQGVVVGMFHYFATTTVGCRTDCFEQD